MDLWIYIYTSGLIPNPEPASGNAETADTVGHGMGLVMSHRTVCRCGVCVCVCVWCVCVCLVWV